jgi:hypothetical protein
MELGDQPAAQQDHHRAQHDGADDADHQHPLLEVRRHREVGEDHQEHEDVVHRQALLDQVAGEELHALGVGHGRAVVLVDGPPEQAVEGEAQRHPDE